MKQNGKKQRRFRVRKSRVKIGDVHGYKQYWRVRKEEVQDKKQMRFREGCSRDRKRGGSG